MNVRWAMRILIGALVAIAPLSGTVQAQGFAGTGVEAEGFAQPQPRPSFTFPADHGPHRDYKIEWWYLTANLEGPDGTPYGLQWTLFRSALTPGIQPKPQAESWRAQDIWFAHAAITTPEAHHVAERFARGGTGQAGVVAAPFEAWIDEWQMAGKSFDKLSLTAAGADFAYDAQLRADTPLIFHGDGGYSVKSAQGQASYYYSQPRFDVRGTLTLPSGDVPVTGQAWLDREWSSQPLAANQTGWDWFSLSFDDGSQLMTFRLRQSDGEFFASATWIDADGTSAALPQSDIIATPLATAQVEGRDIPVKWNIKIPSRDVDIEVEALNADAWMRTAIAYWEGPVRVRGSHGGRGYLEMTGYE